MLCCVNQQTKAKFLFWRHLLQFPCSSIGGAASFGARYIRRAWEGQASGETQVVTPHRCFIAIATFLRILTVPVKGSQSIVSLECMISRYDLCHCKQRWDLQTPLHGTLLLPDPPPSIPTVSPCDTSGCPAPSHFCGVSGSDPVSLALLMCTLDALLPN